MLVNRSERPFTRGHYTRRSMSDDRAFTVAVALNSIGIGTGAR